MRSGPLPIPEIARTDFSYDQVTGDLHRIAREGRPLPAPVLQSRLRAGYLSVCIRGRDYLAHRVIWFIATGESPSLGLDHINGVKTDNRRCNLRLATAAQNTANRKKFKANGLPKGVSRGYGGKFTASISLNRNQHYLGTFDSAESASAAYRSAAEVLHGEFARGDF